MRSRPNSAHSAGPGMMAAKLRGPRNNDQVRKVYVAGVLALIWCRMRALLAYVLAVSALLGGGYMGLRWLSEPPNASADQRLHGGEKASRESKVVFGKSDPSVTDGTRAESESDTVGKSEPLERNARSAVRNESTTVPSPLGEAPTRSAGQEGADQTEAKGVAKSESDTFAKSEPLERNVRSAVRNEAATVPSLGEAPTRPADEESDIREERANQKSIKPPGSEVKAKGENSAPVSEAKSGGGKKGKIERWNTRNPDQMGMMMIMKTIFPRW
jgi:hypothetical protein